MVFSSPVFLFLFLPVLLAAYFGGPRSWRNALLLSASLLFYAWGEGFYLLVMLASITANYLFGLAVDRHRQQRVGRRWLGVGVAINLALLASCKYANFLADNANTLLGAAGFSRLELAPVHLPIGISFFTFQAITYIVDVYRGETPASRNPLHVALYIALFPQLIAGPIVRYHDVARQIVERSVKLADFARGIERFTFGLAKKMLVANPLGQVADQIFSLPAAQVHPALAWLGVACYTLQIYFDFSGYSDMAIGLGRMFGFSFPENFNYPYISRSVREFWRRWHISLSTWFRDYLYIPLGGNRLSPARTHFNLLLVFFLCGLWHGASWNFVIWGLLHGALLVVERGRFGAWIDRLWQPLQHAYVLLMVMIAWVFFRVEKLPDAIGYLKAMFGLGATPLHFPATYLSNDVRWSLLFGILFVTPLLPFLRERYQTLNSHWTAQSRMRTLRGLLSATGTATLLVLLLLSAASVAAGTFNPFLYFRF
ncbi:MAG: MBOAT family protein [Nitrospirota bacterium]|nr:MBOAT family protein [Nitrospirota bacterium]